MLDHIVKTNDKVDFSWFFWLSFIFKFDYIVVTGDLMSHDVRVFSSKASSLSPFQVWNYNNISHMSFIKNISDNLKTWDFFRESNKIKSALFSYFKDTPILQVIGNHEGVPIDNVAPHFAPRRWSMNWFVQFLLRKALFYNRLYGSMLKNWGDYIPGDQNDTMM